MALGLIGRKCGMTRIYTPDGKALPVTVVEVLKNRVSQCRTQDRDGYVAVQIAAGEKRATRVSKPVAGHLAKAGVGLAEVLKEFRVDAEADCPDIGTELDASLFAAGQKVDVTGSTIGKGYAGAVKRHHFRTQDASHGNSLSHRAPGSIGQNQTPGRVFKGRRMAGHLGAERRTIQNLEVVKVDAERGLLLIKGAVPGARGGKLLVRPAVKATKA